MMRRGTWISIVCGLLAGIPIDATSAAKCPLRSARKCRQGIAHAFQELARLGFREVDRCESQRAAGRADRDCTALQSGEGRSTPYRRWEYRTREIVTARCPLDTPARAPFPVKEFSADVVAGDPQQVVPDVAVAVEASARALQVPAVAALSGPAGCVADVASGRSRVATATMRTALRCQRRLDHSATVFGPLDTSCEASAADDGVVRGAAGRIAAACAGVTGPEVGTCAPLPGCVIDAATATGIALARLAFGQCGNGAIDGDEQCDDGNQVPDDGCDRCTAPVCGNGRVESGEQCDDGNQLDNDGCTDCLTAICGDGIVDAGIEACDDGNDVPFDGCTDCQSDPVACSAAGVVATVRLDFDESFLVAGLRVRIRYATDALEMPGRLVGSAINQRVDNLTGVTGSFGAADRDLLPSEEAPDGVDDTLQTILAVASGAIPPGPYVQIRFDCLAAEARASQLTCFVDDVTDPFLNPISQAAVAKSVRCSIELETAPEQ